MARSPHSRSHWNYVWVPAFGAFVWFGTILALLITWLAQGRPKYVSQDGKIAYISDVGANFLKPLFVVGACVTAVSFVASLVIERWLRRNGRLVPSMRKRETAFAVLSIIFGFIGGAGIILLSGFDTARHPSLHRVFLLVFVVGVIFSALFTIIEYRWIAHDFAGAKRLRRAYMIKAVVAGILFLLAVAFGITLYKAPDVGAIIEWVVALLFTFYMLTFVYDLRLSKNIAPGHLTKDMLIEEGHYTRGNESPQGARFGNGVGAQEDMGIGMREQPGSVPIVNGQADAIAR